MAASCGKSHAQHDNENADKDTDQKPNSQSNNVSLARIHRLLDGMAEDDEKKTPEATMRDDEDTMNLEDEAHAEASRQSEQMRHALHVMSQLWACSGARYPAT